MERISCLPVSGQEVTYSSICIVYHASQECGLVLQVSHTKALQSRHSVSTDTPGPSIALVRLALHFSFVPSGQPKLADIRDNDECPSEHTFVTSLSPFNHL